MGRTVSGKGQPVDANCCTKSLTWEVQHAGTGMDTVGFRINKIGDMEVSLSGGYDNMGVFEFEMRVDRIAR